MAVTNFSPLLGLALPTTGDLSGTWGTTVNDSITSLIDSAVAGTTTLSADTDVTLSTTNGASNQARNAVILWTASNGATTRVITAPAQSKAYVVINAGTGSITVKASGRPSGPTIASGFKALIAFNGTDFVTIASSLVNLTSDVTGTLPVANGGTGQTSYTNGQLLIGNTTGNTLTKATITAGSGVTITNGNGSIEISATGTGGTVTSVTATAPITSSGGSSPNLSFLAPGTAGNVLTSVAGAWASAALPSGSSLKRSTRASNTILGTADQGYWIDVTGGTFTQTFTAAATLGDGWWCYYGNSGSGVVTLDPNASELIDGLSSFAVYPQEIRIIQCTGTTFNSFVVNGFDATFTSTTTITIPPGYTKLAFDMVAGGGGGGSGTTGGTASYDYATGGGGGGAGARVVDAFPLSYFGSAGSSLVLTVGAGGATGSVGGNSSIGSVITVYGGGGGSGGNVSGFAYSYGGGGGGQAGVGSNGTASTAGAVSSNGGPPAIYANLSSPADRGYFLTNTGFGGGSAGSSATWGGGGGGVAYGSGGSGGSSVYGPGGGGAGGSNRDLGSGGNVGGAGGTSMSFSSGGGGAGGAAGASGTSGTTQANGMGSGGGGGGSLFSGNGGAGSAGGFPGGGGGGGGAGGVSTGTAGTGGTGAGGQIKITGVF